MLHTLVVGYPTEQIVVDSDTYARSLGMEPIDMAVSNPQASGGSICERDRRRGRGTR